MWLVFILRLLLFFTICQSFTFAVPPSSSSAFPNDLLASGEIVDFPVADSLLKK
jgi:hypothetical protein